MIYLASPYSHPDPLIMKTRFLLAEEVTACYTRRGVHVYSPIVHYHEMAAKYKFPSDFEFWRKLNFDMLRRADELWVLEIPGWKESKGVTAEIAMWNELGMFQPTFVAPPSAAAWQE